MLLLAHAASRRKCAASSEQALHLVHFSKYLIESVREFRSRIRRGDNHKFAQQLRLKEQFSACRVIARGKGPQLTAAVAENDIELFAKKLRRRAEGEVNRNAALRFFTGLAVFLHVKDKGRVRLNATNLTGPANFPTHEEAERLAARLARFGFNCVRFHYMDGSYGNFMMPPEQGILALDPKSQRALDPARLERMDYLVAALKKRGIYINMNLHVARNLDERDGVAPGTPGANKGVDQFDERIISLEKEYARDLLSHVNQYTGMSYLKDPAVAVVEL